MRVREGPFVIVLVVVLVLDSSDERFLTITS
jgi:hypothetical protein